MPMVRLETLPAAPWRLILHAGAGGRLSEFTDAERAGYAAGLETAYRAGERVLAEGGAALDAVCATVRALEDCPLFNAGRGATLTAAGTAEHDACVCPGDGRVGAVTLSRHAKNPVDVARAVMETTPHVILADPSDDFVQAAGVELKEPAYFVTDARAAQLRRLQSQPEAQHQPTEVPQAERHGTVGAVAVDASGIVAAATSTGGMVNKLVGRVGDTPVPGAGTFARDGVVAVSCTGHGEAFLRGVVAHDVYARLAYGHEALPDAVTHTILTELDARGSDGGLIALTADGSGVAAHNSAMMFTAFRRGDQIETWV